MGFPTFCGRLGGGVTVLGIDMVSGLSGFGESEMFCKPGESDLNNFCCMLRTLVAMLKRGRERWGGRDGGVPNTHTSPLFFTFFTVTHPTPSPISILMTSLAFCGVSIYFYRPISGPSSDPNSRSASLCIRVLNMNLI